MSSMNLSTTTTHEENINSLFREGIVYLSQAYKNFKKLCHDFGLAKTSIWIAEFYLETTHGLPINLNIEPKLISDYLEDAVRCF